MGMDTDNFASQSTPSYTIYEMPKVVGAWMIGGKPGLCFYMRQKPRWLTRWVCGWLLEWRWEDSPTRN